MAVAVGEQRRRREAMDLLVSEISKGEEENISTSIRIAIERGWLRSFMDSLSDAKRRKETEIDRICSRHYGDFLTSVSEMLKLRNEAGQLTLLVNDVHRKFNTTGGDLVAVVNDLNVIQTERENARKLLECTMQCKKISSLMVQTKQQIENDDHYNAMRTIEAVQNELKHPVIKPMKSMTARLMDSWLPVSINKLLYGARVEADSFLSDLREHIEVIGATVLRRQARLEIDPSALLAFIQSTAAAVEEDHHHHHGRATGSSNSSSGSSDHGGNYRISSSSSSRGGVGLGDRRSGGSVHHDFSAGGGDYHRTPGINNTGANKLPSSSASLQHIFKNARVFDLSHWARPNDFEGTVPIYFQQQQHQQGYQQSHMHNPLAAATADLDPVGADLVDNKLCELGPLHKVLHLYTILGDLNAYHVHYRDLRQQYLERMLEVAERIANQNGIAVVLPRLFNQIIGFFTIENSIRRCVEIPEGVFSVSELGSLWESVCQEIGKIFRDLAVLVTTPDTLICIKETILLLAGVASDESFAFTTRPLFDIMSGLWEVFHGVQLSHATRTCVEALQTCTYQPFCASTLQQFQTQVLAFQLDVVEPAEEVLLSSVAATGGSMSSGGGGGGSSSSSSNTSATLAGAVARRRSSMQLRDRESRREKTMQMGKAAANLDALEEELSASITLSSSGYHHGQQQGVESSMGEAVRGGGVGGKGVGFADADNPISHRRHSGGAGAGVHFVPIANTAGAGAGAGAGAASSSPTTLPAARRRSSGVPPPTTTTAGTTTTTRGTTTSSHSTAAAHYTPQTYSFSSAVPQLLRQLHILVVRFFLFAVKNSALGMRSGEICGTLTSAFQSICDALKRELSEHGVGTPLPKACQIAIDGATLIGASDGLWLMVENGLKHFHWTENLDKYILRAMEASTLALRQLVLSAQDLIFELLSSKIDDLLESLSFIDTTPVAASTGPHESVDAIVNFLKITLVSLGDIPPTVREAVHFTCCSRVAQGILNYLLAPSVSQVNQLCLLTFENDLKVLGHFSDSCGIDHLRQCFSELQETVTFFLHPSLLQFGENVQLRREQFPCTHTAKLVAIADKLTVTPSVAAGSVSAKGCICTLDRTNLRNLQKNLKIQLQQE